MQQFFAASEKSQKILTKSRFRFLPKCELVTEVIKSEFGTSSVGDITTVGSRFVSGILLRTDVRA